ncbi:MAG: diguanylate cyclase [Nitrosomonas sp.]|nr:diguanylate cyclase [Nitrosomonas sp.]
MSKFKDSSPSAIAREALQRLASSKIPPTPDNYHRIYDQIAGHSSNRLCTSAQELLAELASEIPRSTPDLVSFSNALEQANQEKNWEKYKLALLNQINTAQTSTVSATQQQKPGNNTITWHKTIEQLLKQLDTNHGKMTMAKKRDGVHRVLTRFPNDSNQLKNKINALIESWKILATDADEIIETAEQHHPEQSTLSTDPGTLKTETGAVSLPQNQTATEQFTNQLPQLLAQILNHIATIPLADTEFAKETSQMAQKIVRVKNKTEMEEFASDYAGYLEKFEFNIEDSAKLQRGLLRLLNKLIDSAREVLTEDEWIKKQYTELHETISQPLSQRSVAQADSQLEEISQKQNVIRRGLSDARETLKKMVTCLISNIEELSDETGEFHDKIENYTNQISQTDDLDALNHLLVDLVNETRKMQESTQHYRAEFVSARAEVQAAQEKINTLESELQQMNEKVHEDHLTGVLNRRGLDLAFEKEISRAKRQKQPLCYALIDIDNFKKLNDTHGHKVGDDALVYLVDSIKTTTRIDDIVARYGGEEFVVLLPNTKMPDAVEILSRVRRNLTKQFFLHENKRLLITFSAGVAKYTDDETQEAIFKRADEALYRAKKNGKNLILEAV